MDDEPRALMPLVCDRCAVCLEPAELRRESLDVFGQESVEIREGGRVGYACDRQSRTPAARLSLREKTAAMMR